MAEIRIEGGAGECAECEAGSIGMNVEAGIFERLEVADEEGGGEEGEAVDWIARGVEGGEVYGGEGQETENGGDGGAGKYGAIWGRE